MHITNLRKVGGSVMLAVPPAILDILHLEAGAKVDMAVDGDRLVIQPQSRPKYTLDELLAQSKRAVRKRSTNGSRREEDRAWIELSPVGREL